MLNLLGLCSIHPKLPAGTAELLAKLCDVSAKKLRQQDSLRFSVQHPSAKMTNFFPKWFEELQTNDPDFHFWQSLKTLEDNVMSLDMLKNLVPWKEPAKLLQGGLSQVKRVWWSSELITARQCIHRDNLSHVYITMNSDLEEKWRNGI